MLWHKRLDERPNKQTVQSLPFWFYEATVIMFAIMVISFLTMYPSTKYWLLLDYLVMVPYFELSIEPQQRLQKQQDEVLKNCSPQIVLN